MNNGAKFAPPVVGAKEQKFVPIQYVEAMEETLAEFRVQHCTRACRYFASVTNRNSTGGYGINFDDAIALWATTALQERMDDIKTHIALKGYPQAPILSALFGHNMPQQ